MLTRRFSRRQDHRESLLKNLATSLVLNEKLVTTLPKAKDTRSLVERLINTGKGGGLSALRRVQPRVTDPKAAKRIVQDLSPRYKHVTGGYVRLTQLPPRSGDASPMALLELRGVEGVEKAKEEKVIEGKPVRRTAKVKTTKNARRVSKVGPRAKK